MSEYCWEKGEDEVDHSNDSDDYDDNLRDLVIDSKKEVDQASEEKEDCDVQHDGYVFDHPAYMECLNAFEKEYTDSGAAYWHIWMLGKPDIPAKSLLYETGGEAARETEAETEEPKDVHVNDMTGGDKFVVQSRRRESCSVGDTRNFLSNLSKKTGGHIGRIRFE